MLKKSQVYSSGAQIDKKKFRKFLHRNEAHQKLAQIPLNMSPSNVLATRKHRLRYGCENQMTTCNRLNAFNQLCDL